MNKLLKICDLSSSVCKTRKEIKMKKRFKLENLDCADCANKMENEINKLPGIEKATINFMTAKLTVEAPDEQFDTLLPQISKVISRIEPDCKIK